MRPCVGCLGKASQYRYHQSPIIESLGCRLPANVFRLFVVLSLAIACLAAAHLQRAVVAVVGSRDPPFSERCLQRSRMARRVEMDVVSRSFSGFQTFLTAVVVGFVDIVSSQHPNVPIRYKPGPTRPVGYTSPPRRQSPP